MSMTTTQIGYGDGNGTIIGASATDKIGFYGKTPIVQVATSSTHSTSNIASSTAFSATHAAILTDVVNTLINLGLWAA